MQFVVSTSFRLIVIVILASRSSQLDIFASEDFFEDYMELFEIWCTTGTDIKDGEFAADFQTFIGKDVYNLIRHLDFPENSVPLS